MNDTCSPSRGPDDTTVPKQTLPEQFEAISQVTELREMLKRLSEHSGIQGRHPVPLMLSPYHLEFIEMLEVKWAAYQGRPLRPLYAVLSDLVSGHLEDFADKMRVDPRCHPYYNALWESLSQNAPTQTCSDSREGSDEL